MVEIADRHAFAAKFGVDHGLLEMDRFAMRGNCRSRIGGRTSGGSDQALRQRGSAAVAAGTTPNINADRAAEKIHARRFLMGYVLSLGLAISADISDKFATSRLAGRFEPGKRSITRGLPTV